MPALSHDQKLFICQRLAEFRSIRDVVKDFNERFGVWIFHGQVDYYQTKEKWKAIIDQLRDNFAKELTKDAIANKRVRLRMLQQVYDEAMDKAYSGTDKSGRDKFVFSPMAAVAAVRQAQEEVEGRKVRLAGHDGEELKISWAQRLAQLEETGALNEDVNTDHAEGTS